MFDHQSEYLKLFTANFPRERLVHLKKEGEEISMHPRSEKNQTLWKGRCHERGL